MIWLSRKKLPRLILTAYLAFCVSGVFLFALLGSLPSRDFITENSIPEGRVHLLGNYFDQYPAEEPAITGKLGTAQFSPLRLVFQRGVSLIGSPHIGSSFSQLFFKANTKIQHTNSKDVILLKLRI
jgi:hypothetical protein